MTKPISEEVAVLTRELSDIGDKYFGATGLSPIIAVHLARDVCKVLFECGPLSFTNVTNQDLERVVDALETVESYLQR